MPSDTSGFNILEPKSNPSRENEFERVKMKNNAFEFNLVPRN